MRLAFPCGLGLGTKPPHESMLGEARGLCEGEKAACQAQHKSHPGGALAP